MHLLYLDESGSHDSAHFILAGLAVAEADGGFIVEQFNRLQLKYLPSEVNPINFHAADIRGGRSAPWSSLSKDDRRAILDAGFDTLVTARCTLFAVTVQRAWLTGGQGEYDFAFESIMPRFDSFLRRIRVNTGEPAHGLVILAQSQYQQRLEILGRQILREGTRWGQLRHLVEAPLFAPIVQSRILQGADLVANAVFGRYEHGLALQFDKIAHKFDQAQGVVHGLAHFTRTHQDCMCPACFSRRAAGS